MTPQQIKDEVEKEIKNLKNRNSDKHKNCFTERCLACEDLECAKAKLSILTEYDKAMKEIILDDLKDIEYTKDNLEQGEDYGEDDEQDLIHFHQLEGRRLALEELLSQLNSKIPKEIEEVNVHRDVRG